MNNLEPVKVEIQFREFYVPVTKEIPISLQDWLNLYSAYGFQRVPPEKITVIHYKDILKNLTTNISYE